MAEISKQALIVENNQSFPDNNSGTITPSDLRSFNVDMIASTVNQTVYTTDSGSWNSKITQLNAFTASQQPSFTALNSFTASQLTINTGVNGFTQSAGGRLNNLELYTASFTTSVGIFDESVFVQNVNQINFMGNGITASYVSGKAVVGVDFTPLNNFTASTSTQLNALQGNFNSYTSSTNAAIAAILITTASLATTGSNTFTENNNFTKNIAVTQSIYVGENIYVQGGIEATYIKTIYETASVIYSSGSNQFGDSLLDTQILSGSSYVEGELYVNKLNVTSQFSLLNSFTASQLTINTGYNTFTASTNSDLTAIHLTTQSLNAFTASQLLTNNTLTTTASFNSFTASQNLLNLTFATTGSNSFIGNQIVNGVVSISSSATYDLDITGGFQATAASRISGSNGIASISQTTVQVTSGSGANLVSSIMARGYVAATSASNQIALYGGLSSIGNFGSGKVGGGIAVSSGSAGTYYFPIEFQASTAYTDGRVTFTTPIVANNSLIVTGSLTLTGSVYQNVISQSIVDATASIDLSKANFYTVVLPTSANTVLNITNPGKGQTAMIQITTNTLATASFSSNVKQPSGFGYLPSTGSGAIDVLTLACFDGTNLLVTNVTNLV